MALPSSCSPGCRNFLLYTTTPRIASAVSKKDIEGVSRITAQVLPVPLVSVPPELWVFAPVFASFPFGS